LKSDVPQGKVFSHRRNRHNPILSNQVFVVTQKKKKKKSETQKREKEPAKKCDDTGMFRI
jgi:hypothetical protein